jgi:hypothetical protein
MQPGSGETATTVFEAGESPYPDEALSEKAVALLTAHPSCEPSALAPSGLAVAKVLQRLEPPTEG